MKFKRLLFMFWSYIKVWKFNFLNFYYCHWIGLFNVDNYKYSVSKQCMTVEWMNFSWSATNDTKSIRILTFSRLSDSTLVNVCKYVWFNANKSQLISHLENEIWFFKKFTVSHTTKAKRTLRKCAEAAINWTVCIKCTQRQQQTVWNTNSPYRSTSRAQLQSDSAISPPFWIGVSIG